MKFFNVIHANQNRDLDNALGQFLGLVKGFFTSSNQMKSIILFHSNSDPVELSDFETAKEESSGTNDSGSSNENESESSDNEEAEVANSLTPPSRILRERTSKLKTN
ncbi:hypothetical protein MJO29_004438 [Puccinia striiformis f. sp. tritici]|nr:hypothetical protein MJO29_004438 [Puccinia striiformis f. sp. tritici]